MITCLCEVGGLIVWGRILVKDVVEDFDDVGPENARAAELLNHAHQHDNEDWLVNFRNSHLTNFRPDSIDKLIILEIKEKYLLMTLSLLQSFEHSVGIKEAC